MFILTGILLGLGTLSFIGPVLFYLLQASVAHGKRMGFAVALGVLLGDIICVVAAVLGGKAFFENPDFQWWMSLNGGFILLVLGLKNVLSSARKNEVKTLKNGTSWWIHFTNGFLINFVNPFVFAVWFGFAAYNQSIYSELETILSLCITLLVIFTTDILKAYYADRLTLLIQPYWLLRIYRLAGIVILLFAGRLFYYAFIEY